MPQTFTPGSVLAIKLVLIVIALAIPAGAIALYHIASGPVALEHAPAQPIPFSHEHHVGADGIDCRYCHDSVENADFATLPATSVCMTCHSQLYTDAPMLAPLRKSERTGIPIAWKRVYQLPDFVYFSHQIHVAKGIGCVQCHGHVELMPVIRRVASLDMQWCLGCHRRYGGQPGRPSVRRLTDCSTCHR